jgi:hypothetical protein
MPDLVKIPITSAEYQVRFDRPYVGLIANDRPRAFEAVVNALLPFNFRLANTEVITTGTLADYKVIFKIPERGITFQFSAEEYRFGKEGSSWATAKEDVEVLIAAERALVESVGVEAESCMVTVALHLEPLSRKREEMLAPFVPEPFRKFMSGRKVETSGNHLKFADGDILLDFSLLLANGIFVRFTSKFFGRPPHETILAKVRRDEEAIFAILGVEEATDA